MRTTGRRGEPDRSKTGASRHLPVRRESDNPRKGKPDRSEVGGGRPLNRVQKERQLKQDIGEIEATELADGSVTEAKLASGAVTSTKIGVNAITEDNISSASISESKINDGSVTTVKLADNNVTLDKIAFDIHDSVLLTHVTNTGSVTSVSLQQGGQALGENEVGVPVDRACTSNNAVVTWRAGTAPAGTWTLTLKKKAAGSRSYTTAATMTVNVNNG